VSIGHDRNVVGLLLDAGWDKERDWEEYFSWYLNNGWTETGADDNAWKDLQAKYEGLMHYEGCKAQGGRHGR
jgi:hypothetical protein